MEKTGKVLLHCCSATTGNSTMRGTDLVQVPQALIQHVNHDGAQTKLQYGSWTLPEQYAWRGCEIHEKPQEQALEGGQGWFSHDSHLILDSN